MHPAPSPKRCYVVAEHRRLLFDVSTDQGLAREIPPEAHKRFPRQVYKYQATNLACMGTGGPCKYTGRSPKEAHQHLQITETEWQEMVKIFRDSMNSFKVPLKEQDEVVAILESSKADVVVSSGKSASR